MPKHKHYEAAYRAHYNMSQLTNNEVYAFNHWVLPELKKEA